MFFSLYLEPKDEVEEEKRKLGLPKLLPGVNPFKNFTIRKLKIGSILAFLDKLGLDETKNQLITLIKAIKVSSKIIKKVMVTICSSVVYPDWDFI